LTAAAIASAPPASPSAALDALLEELWQARLFENPLFATRVGDHRYDDRLDAVSPADRARVEARLAEAETRLAAIDRAALSAEEQVSLDMALRDVRDERAALRFGLHRIPLTAEAGFHSYLPRLASDMPLRTTQDYERYIARLRAFRPYFEQQIANMREGLRAGFTQPRIVLDGFEDTIAAHVVDTVERSAFDTPFRAFPPTVPAADQERLRRAGRDAIRESVVPAYHAWLTFFRDEYRPGTRATIAASDSRTVARCTRTS
jgi:uncharacterized protein (DUF885 family)